MTVITISTVGYQEVRPLHPGGEVLTMTVIAFGVIDFLYTFGILVELMSSGEWQRYWRTRRVERRLSDMADHVIVCGYGRTGRQVVSELIQSKGPSSSSSGTRMGSPTSSRTKFSMSSVTPPTTPSWSAPASGAPGRAGQRRGLRREQRVHRAHRAINQSPALHRRPVVASRLAGEDRGGPALTGWSAPTP